MEIIIFKGKTPNLKFENSLKTQRTIRSAFVFSQFVNFGRRFPVFQFFLIRIKCVVSHLTRSLKKLPIVKYSPISRENILKQFHLLKFSFYYIISK